MKKSDGMKKRPTATENRPGIRDFIQANRSANVKRSSASFFHDETKVEDLSSALVQNARKSGVLNLSGRNLINVPLKVFTINELDKREQRTLNLSLDSEDNEKWWEFVELQKLILANNAILEIPPGLSKLGSLQVLDIHDNQLAVLPEEIGALELLTKLDASQNKIRTLPKEFYNLRRLVELKLDHNCLESLDRDVSNFDSLRILDLSHNNLTALPGDIGFLSSLTHLNISFNRINNLSIDLNGLSGLRTLDVSENCLEKLLPNIFDSYSHLEILYLQRNKITTLPNFNHCSALKELHMQSNAVTEFSSENFAQTKISLIDLRFNKVYKFELDVDDLEFLDRFYLEGNNISSLPDELGFLRSLKALTLEGNPLRGIRQDILQRGTQELIKYLKGRVKPGEVVGASPDAPTSRSKGGLANPPTIRHPTSEDELGIDIHRLKNTHVLNLESKQIRAVEDKVFEDAAEAKISTLNLGKNQLTFLQDSFEKVCGNFLTELTLDFNRLSALPPCIGKCSKLTFLSFQNNLVESLPEEFANLSFLREINFSYNKFTSIPDCIYKMQSLEILIGSENKITLIEHEKLMNLKKSLAVIDLRNNSINQLPPELSLLKQLRALSLEGNLFRVPGQSILSQGTPAILRYLSNRIVQK